ncbi:MAG TPA: nitroreductase family deazaflavin-dependent oxidoreductase [Micromonosporaceae bacterium]|nr:nitroreductase family deazaflavin-dependent oxidoreductase [Micromonosporaceae bacterium]
MMSPMPLRRIVKHLGHQSWFAKLGKAIVPLDKGVTKLTGGRVVALGLLPSLTLTTTGKKSGLERSQPLAYTPDGDDIVLLGSNWGGPKHPAWSYNLLANPRAKVRVKGKTYSVTARLVTGAEREAMWQLALQVWPAYATYAKRAPHREIRVFHLTKD